MTARALTDIQLTNDYTQQKKVADHSKLIVSLILGLNLTPIKTSSLIFFLSQRYFPDFNSVVNKNQFKKKLLDNKQSYRYLFSNIEKLINESISNLNDFPFPSDKNPKLKHLLLLFLNGRRLDAYNAHIAMQTIITDLTITTFGLLIALDSIFSNFLNKINNAQNWSTLLTSNLRLLQMRNKGNVIAILLDSDESFRQYYNKNKYFDSTLSHSASSHLALSHVQSSQSNYNSKKSKMNKSEPNRAIQAVKKAYAKLNNLCSINSLDSALYNNCCVWFQVSEKKCINSRCPRSDLHFCKHCHVVDGSKVSAHGMLSCPKLKSL